MASTADEGARTGQDADLGWAQARWDRAKAARQSLRKGPCGYCFSFVGMYLWVCVAIGAVASYFPSSSENHIYVSTTYTVEKPTCSSANMTCDAAEQGMWKQFATLVRGLDGAGTLSESAMEQLKQLQEEDTCGHYTDSLGTEQPASSCTSCMCRKLEDVGSSFQTCEISSVFGAMRDQSIMLDELNQTALRMPPDTRSCMDHFARAFPPSMAEEVDAPGCGAEATRTMMNDFLDVLRLLQRNRGRQVTFITMVAVGMVFLGYLIRNRYLSAKMTVEMSPEEQRNYALEHKRLIPDVVTEEAWEDKDKRNKLTNGFTESEHSVNFWWGYSDLKRSMHSFLSGEGGNLATVAELKHLEKHREVHVLSGSDKSAATASAASEPNQELGPGAREVLCHGSTAINLLCWRKSMLRVCLIVLGVSMLVHLSSLWAVMIRAVSNTGLHHGIELFNPVAPQSDVVTDPFMLAADSAEKICFARCAVEQKSAGLSGVNACSSLCEELAREISGGDSESCLGAKPEATSVQIPDLRKDEHELSHTMEDRFIWYRLIETSASALVTGSALYKYRQAEKCWHDVRSSSAFVLSGWIWLFLLPMIISLVPWYIVLNFDGEFENAKLVEQISGFNKGLRFKGNLALGMYLNTFSIGLACCRSSIRAVAQCKMLIPRSSLWTGAFNIIPLFAVVLQWPSFAVIGTIADRKSVWAFLLVFTVNPLTFLVMSNNILHLADTPAKAHGVLQQAKSINRYLYLVALFFVAMELQQFGASWLQKFCLALTENDYDNDVWDCLPKVVGWQTFALIDIPSVWKTIRLIVTSTSSFLVSYFVTVLALVDQLLAMSFFLWEHDGYMSDDRQVYELSFLYAQSLYEIRTHSKALVSSFQAFLVGNRKRIEWISSLENYKAAFDCCDSSLDGKISHDELKNMLTRLTFDGGYIDGDDTAICSCKACTAWQNVRLETPNCKMKVSAITVDWEKFTDLFKTLDQDNSGELDFREFVCLARGISEGETEPELSASESRDVAAFLIIVAVSAGRTHRDLAWLKGGDYLELARCQCRSCSLRRLGGLSSVDAAKATCAEELLGWAGFELDKKSRRQHRELLDWARELDAMNTVETSQPSTTANPVADTFDTSIPMRRAMQPTGPVDPQSTSLGSPATSCDTWQHAQTVHNQMVPPPSTLSRQTLPRVEPINPEPQPREPRRVGSPMVRGPPPLPPPTSSSLNRPAVDYVPQHTSSMALGTIDAQLSMREEITRVWQTLDPSGSGLLSWQQAQKILIQLGLGQRPVDLKAFFDDVDPSCHGEVSFQDFMRWWEVKEFGSRIVVL